MNDIETMVKGVNILPVDISAIGLFQALLVAATCSFVISLIYTRYGRSLNNRYNFSANFIMLAVTTTIVISVVKFSFALSLGLVGALSIVRFRSAIREPEEIIYLFMVIAIGIAAGASQFYAAFIFTLFACVTTFTIHKFYLKKLSNTMLNVNLLKLTIPRNTMDVSNPKIIKILSTHTNFFTLKNYSVSKKEANLTYVFSNLVKKEDIFLQELNDFAGKDISFNIISNFNIPE
ncbi:DUF4956 domain-containing protein [Methylophilaceae bacterium]|nr:DUF4956 domain-containing protein [Methylophilaceae bacterium]